MRESLVRAFQWSYSTTLTYLYIYSYFLPLLECTHPVQSRMHTLCITYTLPCSHIQYLCRIRWLQCRDVKMWNINKHVVCSYVVVTRPLCIKSRQRADHHLIPPIQPIILCVFLHGYAISMLRMGAGHESPSITGVMYKRGSLPSTACIDIRTLCTSYMQEPTYAPTTFQHG